VLVPSNRRTREGEFYILKALISWFFKGQRVASRTVRLHSRLGSTGAGGSAGRVSSPGRREEPSSHPRSLATGAVGGHSQSSVLASSCSLPRFEMIARREIAVFF